MDKRVINYPIPKVNKYHNIKTIVNGIEFDSKKEARRYQDLLYLQKSGYIENLELQKPFELQPSFKKNGKTIRAITYIADFYYFDILENKWVVEDTKGVRTDVYKLKKKLFEYKYPKLTIEEL